jgi:hypothetical protein
LVILVILAMVFLTLTLLRNKLLTKGFFLLTSRFRKNTKFVYYRLQDCLQARPYQLRTVKMQVQLLREEQSRVILKIYNTIIICKILDLPH